jgi:hypothetical protein
VPEEPHFFLLIRERERDVSITKLNCFHSYEQVSLSLTLSRRYNNKERVVNPLLCLRDSFVQRERNTVEEKHHRVNDGLH